MSLRITVPAVVILLLSAAGAASGEWLSLCAKCLLGNGQRGVLPAHMLRKVAPAR